jgi:hypothetical protein
VSCSMSANSASETNSASGSPQNARSASIRAPTRRPAGLDSTRMLPSHRSKCTSTGVVTSSRTAALAVNQSRMPAAGRGSVTANLPASASTAFTMSRNAARQLPRSGPTASDG